LHTKHAVTAILVWLYNPQKEQDHYKSITYKNGTIGALYVSDIEIYGPLTKRPALNIKCNNSPNIRAILFFNNRVITMNTEITSKKAVVQAVGFALLLVTLALPLSVLGIKLLNFVLGQIQI